MVRWQGRLVLKPVSVDNFGRDCVQVVLGTCRTVRVQKLQAAWALMTKRPESRTQSAEITQEIATEARWRTVEEPASGSARACGTVCTVVDAVPERKTRG